jgi:hypothetical protein
MELLLVSRVVGTDDRDVELRSRGAFSFSFRLHQASARPTQSGRPMVALLLGAHGVASPGSFSFYGAHRIPPHHRQFKVHVTASAPSHQVYPMHHIFLPHIIGIGVHRPLLPCQLSSTNTSFSPSHIRTSTRLSCALLPAHLRRTTQRAYYLLAGIVAFAL